MTYKTTGLVANDPRSVFSLLKEGNLLKAEAHRLVDEVWDGHLNYSTGNDGLISSITDEQAVEFLVSNGRSADAAQAVVNAWRQLAASMGYTGSVAWRVKAGFTLKQSAPQEAGLCYKNFQYLQDWSFVDEPTEDAVAFWIPRLVVGSTSKNVAEQKAILLDLRRKFNLPETHLVSFGRAAILVGLIIAHYKATEERVPLSCCWARTDIYGPGGLRLYLGNFDEYGLDCGHWAWDEDRSENLGVFALGVELGH